MVKLYFFFLTLLFGSFCFGQKEQTQTSISSERQLTAKDEPINFYFLDDYGNEMRYIMTWDERRKIEDRIKEYEKQNNIIDRGGKIYFINSNYDVVLVKEQEKK